ncbi:hypothetical protein PARHAE_02045 [Paracoccus haematequi]|uniref:Uncharacterized protein n=2 Tax=Paracoccus haematequi TaxID=2491866 RepID=A0A447IN12_9RHOB|nr:hypothetical protein PARHAE_02045 [Paracoccus haematequi]
MKVFRTAMAAVVLSSGAAAAQDCASLTAAYSKFDNALIFFDRSSKSESSTLRAETAQSAMTNILLRQGIIVDMMIAGGCELPPPPDFQFLGMIASHN